MASLISEKVASLETETPLVSNADATFVLPLLTDVKTWFKSCCNSAFFWSIYCLIELSD